MVQSEIRCSLKYGTVWNAVQSEVRYSLKYGTVWNMVQSEIWYNLKYGTILSMVQSEIWYNLKYGRVWNTDILTKNPSGLCHKKTFLYALVEYKSEFC